MFFYLETKAVFGAFLLLGVYCAEAYNYLIGSGRSSGKDMNLWAAFDLDLLPSSFFKLTLVEPFLLKKSFLVTYGVSSARLSGNFSVTPMSSILWLIGGRIVFA